MTHFLIHYQYLSDGTTVVSPTESYDSLDLAKSSWHTKMAYNMVAENVLGSLTIIHTNNGQIELNDSWVREVKVTEAE